MKSEDAAQRGRWITTPFFRWSVAIVGTVVGGLLVFESLDISVFKRIGLAHEYCYLREPKLVWLHVTSDVLIGVAYLSISGTLAYLVYKASRNIPFNWVFLAFGLFIVSCGLTHFMEVWVIWEPVYWLSGYVKIVTAAASVATAIALYPLVPRIFRLIESARQGEQRRLEIEDLNKELERFNYSVAHDLRGPLRGITGIGQALREDYGAQLPAEAQSYIEKMQASAARMDLLISDLLRYASIGQQQIERKPVSLDAVLRGVMTLLETEISSAGGEIVVPLPLPAVIGDPVLLQVVFQNLVANSLKFVAPGVRPRIEIRAVVESAIVTVTVSDNGLGIPNEVRESVFKIFERFHPNHPGTGIGLAIVLRSVERMKGRIGLADSSGRTGTQFWIQLPLAPT